MLKQPGDSVYLRYKSPFRDTTLFPQAQIYDSDSGAQLTTVNLIANATDLSIYEASYTVPSAEGVYHIVIVPFTNAGRTNESEVEGDTIENLEVQTIAKAQPTSSFGGPIITENDLKLLAKLVADKLQKTIELKIPEFPEQKEVDLKPILEAIKAKPEIEATDLSPVLSAIGSIQNGLGLTQKALKNVGKTDLAGVEGQIGSLRDDLAKISYAPVEVMVNQVLEEVTAVKNGLPVDQSDKVVGKFAEYIQSVENNLIALKGVMATNADIQLVSEQYTSVFNGLASVRELIFKADELQKKRLEVFTQSLLQALQQMGFVNNTALSNAFASLSNKINTVALGDE